MSVTIYHNPRCGKSRAALEILTGRGGVMNAERIRLGRPPEAMFEILH